MTFEDAEVSRILRILMYQLQETWNRYEDTSRNLLHYGADCRAWAGLIREEVLLEIKNSSTKQPGIPSNAINIALEILMSHTYLQHTRCGASTLKK